MTWDNEYFDGSAWSEQVTLTVSGVAYSASVPLRRAGRSGEIAHVTLREDVTLDEGSAGVLIIAYDSSIDAATPDEFKVYESDVIALTGDAVTASLIDALANLAVYDGDIYIALRVTAAAGLGASTSVEVRIDGTAR